MFCDGTRPGDLKNKFIFRVDAKNKLTFKNSNRMACLINKLWFYKPFLIDFRIKKIVIRVNEYQRYKVTLTYANFMVEDFSDTCLYIMVLICSSYEIHISRKTHFYSTIYLVCLGFFRWYLTKRKKNVPRRWGYSNKISGA